MVKKPLRPGYRVSCQFSEMNFDVIHAYISRSYWAAGIPAETLQRAINNSLCFGIFTDAGEQVSFARVITDQATYAYLADVFVVESHRGKGLSKWLMQEIVDHPRLQGLRRMVLATRDAHGLYQQFGFKPLANPQTFMEMWTPDAYSLENNQNSGDVCGDIDQKRKNRDPQNTQTN